MRGLRQRVVQRGASVLERLLDPAAAQPLMWRSLAGTYLAAATIMAATLVFGLDDEADVGVLAAIAVGALVAGILLLFIAPRIPEGLMLPALLAGLAGISVAVAASGEADSPYGLAGDEIPLEARILAVADAYEAMTADRPYRASIGVAAAVAELERGAGAQFDAEIVAAFLGAERGARAA